MTLFLSLSLSSFDPSSLSFSPISSVVAVLVLSQFGGGGRCYNLAVLVDVADLGL